MSQPHSAPAPLIVRTAYRYWLVRSAGSALFCVGCAMAMRAGGVPTQVMGGAGLVLFGVLGLYGVRQLLRRAPRITISDAGIEAADLGVGTIPWTHVEAVEHFGSAEAPFLAIVVTEPERYLAAMRPTRRLVTRLLTAQGLPMFSINLMGIDHDPDTIERRARAHLRAAEVRSRASR